MEQLLEIWNSHPCIQWLSMYGISVFVNICIWRGIWLANAHKGTTDKFKDEFMTELYTGKHELSGMMMATIAIPPLMWLFVLYRMCSIVVLGIVIAADSIVTEFEKRGNP